MTGAGSSSVAWAAEQSYLGGVADNPTYRMPGSNLSVDTSELTRNLLEIYAPGDIEAQEFLAQQLEGQLDLSWILSSDQFHRLLFNDGNTGFTNGLANSAEWYLGVDYIGGTTERQIQGWAPATASVEYSGSTEVVRVTVTGAYGNEKKNTSITPGTVNEASDEVPGHGATLAIDGTDVGEKLQSATLSIENISRLQRGTSQKPIEAIAGNVSTTVDMSSIYDGPERYERALGSPGATEVEETVGEVPATLTFDVAGSEVASYDIDRVAPNTYNWTDLVNNDADLNEDLSFNGAGVTGSDPTV